MKDKIIVFDNAYSRNNDDSPQIGFGQKEADSAAALKKIYDVESPDYDQYVYHQANDSSVPTGFFSNVPAVDVFDIRDTGNPNTTCSDEEKKNFSQCIPNPIVIPNPYPFPVRPAVVDIPNDGGFFYVSLNKGAIDGILDGAQYVNVSIQNFT